MKSYERRIYTGFNDRDSGKIYRDLEFRRCTFQGSSLSTGADVQLRSVVQNVQIIDCERVGGDIYHAILEDVLVNGLKTSSLLQTWGAALKHVTLKGRIGRLMITQAADPTGLTLTTAQRQAFDEANAAYYANVDWALDISQAEFQECSIRGVPARLVRRDAETQVVVTRYKALKGGWRHLDLEKTWWPFSIQFMLEREDSDVVLVAPKRHPRFNDLLDGLRLLREAGIAEPD